MTALLVTLEAAVPLRIMEMANWDPQHRIRVARERWAEVLAAGKGFSGGADLMFGGPAAGRECAALITALAAAAYQPGGVEFMGLRWDAPQCETSAALRARPARREVATVEVPGVSS